MFISVLNAARDVRCLVALAVNHSVMVELVGEVHVPHSPSSTLVKPNQPCHNHSVMVELVGEVHAPLAERSPCTGTCTHGRRPIGSPVAPVRVPASSECTRSRAREAAAAKGSPRFFSS